MITILIFLIALLAYYTFGIRYQSIVLTALSLYVYWNVAGWNIIIIVCLTLVSLVFWKLLTLKKKKLYVAFSDNVFCGIICVS